MAPTEMVRYLASPTFQEAIASQEILAILYGCQSSYILTSVDEAEDTLRLDPSPAFGFAVLVNHDFLFL